jgi:hypothetical protein
VAPGFARGSAPPRVRARLHVVRTRAPAASDRRADRRPPRDSEDRAVPERRHAVRHGLRDARVLDDERSGARRRRGGPREVRRRHALRRVGRPGGVAPAAPFRRADSRLRPVLCTRRRQRQDHHRAPRGARSRARHHPRAARRRRGGGRGAVDRDRGRGGRVARGDVPARGRRQGACRSPGRARDDGTRVRVWLLVGSVELAGRLHPGPRLRCERSRAPRSRQGSRDRRRARTSPRWRRIARRSRIPASRS